jgi:hypothetical protein
MKKPPSTQEQQRKWDAAIAAAGVETEAELRASKEAHPKTIGELSAYIEKLRDRPHDYGTCVYAMSLAAVAAFNYIAGQLGVTGFQASCADLDVIRRTRGIKHAFMIVKAEDLLYPQCDPLPAVIEFIREQRAELAPEAAKLLKGEHMAHPDVKAHWRELSKLVKQ